MSTLADFANNAIKVARLHHYVIVVPTRTALVIEPVPYEMWRSLNVRRSRLTSQGGTNWTAFGPIIDLAVQLIETF